MKTAKNTKRSLLMSTLALVMCFAMLLGTTFAWFTDNVTSEGNKIQTGSLKVDLSHRVDDEWISLKDNPMHKIFDYKNWEPGYTRVEALKVENLGSLALQYKLSLTVADGSAELGDNGENLADVIDVYVADGDVSASNYAEIQRSADWNYKGTLAEAMANPSDFLGGALTSDGEQIVMIALHMQESAGNEYQSLSVGNIYVNLIATQWSYEADSFDSDYDVEATFPIPDFDFSATVSVRGRIENGVLTEDVVAGDVSGDIYAQIPAGVRMANGAENLTLTVNSMNESGSNVSATHRSEVLHSVDVHIDGVDTSNTVPMIISLRSVLPSGLNSDNVKLYHVENDQTMEMSLVADPTNHNEFSYDPATGDVVMALASFSEIVVYGDTGAEWDGTVANGFSGGSGTEADPYIIANGEQLAYFRNQVDAGNTFEGKFVKLTSNINLNDRNFDPIGWGYEYDGFTEGGKTFNGTFDGDNHTIFGLYQNGWDANDCGNTYDYSMAGGGLFASVVDATIKNLTISGADIVMECIDMGVVAGYAQGKCTFDNIAIINCTIQNYNRYTGGVVGECSPRYDANGTPLHSNHVFNNIRVDSTTTVSSLWGSFDTSLGGILGGKWDKNGAETKVTMTNCDVACTIDAFNDVTSAYQWYAYRRAGMLIGNTEQSANNKALANFLTCENVHVYYGEWNNYHYCEFENQSGSEDAAWQNNYPWVRVESGLSCGAYSNPRYGHPIVNGIAIADSIHGHAVGDECMVSIPFAQLYGGGQGVYGATEHEGVSEGAYTVTYISYAKTVKVEFVADNSKPHTLWAVQNHTVGTSNPLYWEDGHGEKITTIGAGNTVNYIVYPRWPQELTIRFHDAEGNMLYHEHFQEGSDHTLNMDAVNAALDALQTKLDATKRVVIVSWDQDPSRINLKNAKEDITIHAKYELSTSSITLEPVYNQDGVLTHYEVVDVNEGETIENVVIAIPPYVGTVPVAKLGAGAFAGFDNLHAVVIPHKITHIGTGALAENWKNGTFGSDKGETITIYYEGTYEEWQKITLDKGWYYGVSKDTRVFFMGDDKKVDFEQGYLQFVVDKSNWLGAVKEGHFDYVSEVPESFISEYNKKCDCNVDGCEGQIRPDAQYWQK